MHVMLHLSDLHFGRTDPALLEPLVEFAQALEPDLVVVSGDLTQRARRAQFREARDFLARLPKPQLVVPGNHDIPLYDVFNRFLRPLVRFRRYISDDLEPEYVDDEVAVYGFNSARSLTFKDGRINEEQVARLRRRMCGVPDHLTKVVVSHHPFDLPEDHEDVGDLVGRAPMAMKMFATCGADLLLAGHLHTSHTLDTAARYRIGDWSALVVQAGTATSTRGRGEVNAFNVLRFDGDAVEVERVDWTPAAQRFVPGQREAFHWDGRRWRRDGEAPPRRPRGARQKPKASRATKKVPSSASRK